MFYGFCTDNIMFTRSTMFRLCSFLIVSLHIINVHPFVLLQVRKQNDSMSKIDALIHKIVPNDKVDELKNRFTHRAVKTDNKLITDKTSERKTVDSKHFVEKLKDIETNVTDELSLESVVKSGVKDMIQQENTSDLVDNVSKKILEFVKKSAGPIFRSGSGSVFDLRPEILNLEDKSSPSVMLKLDSNIVTNLISNVFSSINLESFVNHFAKGAAEAYRKVLDTIPEEIIYDNIDKT